MRKGEKNFNNKCLFCAHLSIVNYLIYIFIITLLQQQQLLILLLLQLTFIQFNIVLPSRRNAMLRV